MRTLLKNWLRDQYVNFAGGTYLGNRQRRSRAVRKLKNSHTTVEAMESRILLSAGDLDLSFGGTAASTPGIVQTDLSGINNTDIANDVTVDNQGRILVVGSRVTSIEYSAPIEAVVTRYLSTGLIDTSFGTSGVVAFSFTAPLDGSTARTASTATSVVVQPDGRIVVVGNSGRDTFDYSNLFAVRLTETGAFDTSFDGDGKLEFQNGVNPTGNPLAATARDVIVSGSSIYIVGSANRPFYYSSGDYGYDVSSVLVMKRNLTDGSPDSSFSGDGVALISAPPGPNGPFALGGDSLAVTPTGGVVIAGHEDKIRFRNIERLQGVSYARLMADGSLDPTFGVDGLMHQTTHDSDILGGSTGISLNADGSFYSAIGVQSNTFLAEVFGLARITANGAFDVSFGTNGIVKTLVTPYAPNGTFGYDRGSIPTSLVTQPDGRIVIAGHTFGLYAPPTGGAPLYQRQVAVTRYLVNGTLDSSFSGDGVQFVGIAGAAEAFGLSIAMQNDGKFLVAGYSSAGYSLEDTVLLRLLGDVFVPPSPPTDITLSNNSIVENSANLLIGTLEAVDPNLADTHTFQFVPEAGGNDNAAFTIVGNQLRILASPDYETKSSYTVRIRATDSAGLTFTKILTISVIDIDEDPPTILATNFANSVVASGMTLLTIHFNEPVVGANNASRYHLCSAGPDGLLGNTDDVDISISSVRYMEDPTNPAVGNQFFASLTVDPLLEDVYRLTINDQITDIAGNRLNGDLNTSAGGTWVDDFVVNASTAYDQLYAGGLDNTFGDGGIITTEMYANQSGYALGRKSIGLADGSLVALGGNTIFHFHADGSVDTSFGVSGQIAFPVGAVALSLLVQPDGKIVAAGRGERGLFVARYSADGTFDQSFGHRGTAIVPIEIIDTATSSFDLAIQADGKLVFGMTHYFSALRTDRNFVVGRLDIDGSVDTSFGNGGLQSVDFSDVAFSGSVSSPVILSNLTADPDDVFGNLAIQSDGAIAVFSGRGSTQMKVARLTQNGAFDTSFGVNGKVLIDIRFFISDFNFTEYGTWGGAILPDGKLVVAAHGPDAQSFRGMEFIYLNANGSLDSTISQFSIPGVLTTTGSHFENIPSHGSGGQRIGVESFALANGKFVISGLVFDLDSGLTRAFVDRFNLDGSLDTSFGRYHGGEAFRFWEFVPGSTLGGIPNAGAYSATAMPDGRLLVTGYSDEPGNIALGVARLDSSGILDSSFNSVGYVKAFSKISDDSLIRVLATSDGGSIAVGISGDVNASIVLAKHTSTGSLDNSFGDNGRVITQLLSRNLYASDACILSDGSFLVVGSSITSSGQHDTFVAKYNKNGHLDNAFGDGGVLITDLGIGFSGSAITLQSDGSIVVAGSAYRSATSDFSIAMVRLLADGTLDPGFGNNGVAHTAFTSSGGTPVAAVATDENGRIVVGGHTIPNEGGDFVVWRFNANGAIDSTFGLQGKAAVDFGTRSDELRSLIVQSNGQILISGNSFRGFPGSESRLELARLDSNGSLDMTFGSSGKLIVANGGDVKVGRAKVAPDGSIVIAATTKVGAKTQFTVLHVQSDGSMDGAFGNQGIFDYQNVNDGYDFVGDIALTNDNRILVGGKSLGNFAVLRMNLPSSRQSLAGVNGQIFEIDTSSSGAGQLLPGISGTFDGLNRLNVDGRLFNTGGIQNVDDGGQTVVTAMGTYSKLQVHREVTVPNTGSQSFVRTLDVFTNTSTQEIRTTIRIVGNLGSDSRTTVFSATDVNPAAESTNRWIGTDGGAGSTTSVIHYVHGPSGLQPADLQVSGDNIYWDYLLTVPAGQTVRLAHFTIVADTRTDAYQAANTLIPAAGLGAKAAQFLSAQEIASVANFVLPSHSNTAPSGNSGTVTATEDTPYIFAATDFGFSDPGDTPGNMFKAVKLTTRPTNGTLLLNNAPISSDGIFVNVSDINDGKLKFLPPLNANGAAYTFFTFQVQDDGGTANGGVDLDPTPGTLTIDVTPVDDAPVSQQNLIPITVRMGFPLRYIFPGNTFLDPDGDNFTLSASDLNGNVLPFTPYILSFQPGPNSGEGTLTGTPSQSNLLLHNPYPPNLKQYIQIAATDSSGRAGFTTVEVTYEASPHTAAPATVYVDPTFLLTAPVDPDGAGPATELGYDAFNDIQLAMDAVADGGTVVIHGGEYSSSRTIDTSFGRFKHLTMSLGDGASGQGVAKVVLHSGLNLHPGITLRMDLVGSGSVPGIDYDQLVVDQGIDLGHANLELAGSLTPPPGNTYELLQANSLIDQFSSSNTDNTISFNSRILKVNYLTAGQPDVVSLSYFDVTRPTSNVIPFALGAIATSLQIPVNLTGTDPGLGVSGVKEFDLYVAQGSGGWSKFATVAASNGAATVLYNASSNHTYFFYSIARDNAGNVETKAAVPEATIRVNDFEKPITRLWAFGYNGPSGTSGTGVFPERYSVLPEGRDVGGSRLVSFDIYVSIDLGPYVLAGTTTAGLPDANGNYRVLRPYNVPIPWKLDGLTHRYEFYCRGIDSSGNVEDAPTTPDLNYTRKFNPIAPLMPNFLEVQGGALQRSYIATVDVVFPNAADLGAYVNPDGTLKSTVSIRKYAMDATSANFADPATNVSGVTATVVPGINGGQILRLNFTGTSTAARLTDPSIAGLTGSQKKAAIMAGDGVYGIFFDTNTDGAFTGASDRAFGFHRLLGDANGDRVVSTDDGKLIDYFSGNYSGLNLLLDGDLNGDKKVDSADKQLTTSFYGPLYDSTKPATNLFRRIQRGLFSYLSD